MKKTVLTFAAGVALLMVVVGAGRSSAKPCPGDSPHNERLGLIPNGLVTYDGDLLRRSATNGRYQTDGGRDFDVNTSVVDAIDPQTSCLNTATSVTLTVVDPFTGVESSVQLKAP